MMHLGYSLAMNALATRRLAMAVLSIGLLAVGADGAAAAGNRTTQKRHAPTDKPEPIADARCIDQGKSYIWVEALGTCFNPGGYIWAEAYANGYTDYPSNADSVYGIGTFALTLKTTTNLGFGGPLKTATDVRFQLRTADPYGGGPPELQVEPQTITASWGGVTVGYATSMFDFYANANVEGTDPATIGDSTSLPFIAFTAPIPGGFSATLSLEQGNYRGGGIAPADGNSSADFGQNSAMPDLVAALGQTTFWGQYQVSGALHKVEINGSPDFGGSNPSTWGFAVQAGVKIDLPIIADKDSLYLQTAYVDGATTYLGLVDPSGDFAPPDAYYSPASGFSRVTGWNVTAQYLHNWTPTLNSAVFGGYADFDLNDALAEATYGASGAGNFNAGANLVWSPTSNTTLLAQYIYNYYGAKDYVDTTNGPPDASQDAHDLLLMAQYTF